MQFCELCTGLYHFRKQLRDEKLIQCDCKKENALPKQPDILQLRAEDSKKIVLVLPREGWYFHHRGPEFAMGC